jgi:hypothetical protein
MKILTTLLDIVTAFLSLLQAEGRILKRAVMNVAWTLAFVGIASRLVLAALGFFLAGIYHYLAANISPAAARSSCRFGPCSRTDFRGRRKMVDRRSGMRCASVRVRYPCVLYGLAISQI